MFEAGAILTADQLNDIIAPGWTSYSPVWSSLTGTQPVLNNGTLTGRYRHSEDSDLIVVEFYFADGSTSTEGTGVYGFSLPTDFPATAASVLSSHGAGRSTNLATTEYSLTVSLFSTTVMRLFNNASSVGQTVPFTYDTGDTISGQITYHPDI